MQKSNLWRKKPMYKKGYMASTIPQERPKYARLERVKEYVQVREGLEQTNDVTDDYNIPQNTKNLFSSYSIQPVWTNSKGTEQNHILKLITRLTGRTKGEGHRTSTPYCAEVAHPWRHGGYTENVVCRQHDQLLHCKVAATRKIDTAKRSGGIWVALSNNVWRANKNEVRRIWSSAKMQGRKKWEIPEKTHQPAASSSSTIPTGENLEATPLWVWGSAGIKARGETGDPRENQSTSGIILHDFHMQKSGSDLATHEPPQSGVCTLFPSLPWLCRVGQSRLRCLPGSASNAVVRGYKEGTDRTAYSVPLGERGSDDLSSTCQPVKKRLRHYSFQLPLLAQQGLQFCDY
ncbi:hypothetical protein PR048_008666 [Dryococelus australis]|uniref:Uncharacterized protein n=1 Tax=Dryococelus australis TaxID=614101 RepID=A0ABQ9HXS4_9NEOP|nr:hypothetical protein PR048_008666 [Dryococelus australis]